MATRPTPVLLGIAALAVLFAAGAAATRVADASDWFMLGAASAAALAAIAIWPFINPVLPICVGLLLSIFSGYWAQMGIPLAIDRPILLYGVAAVFLGLLPDARRPQRLRLNGLHLLLAAIVVYTIGSAIFSGTLLEREPIFAMFDRLGIIGFLLFLVAPTVFSESRERDVLLWCLTGLGVYLSLTALFETLGLTQLIFPRYISDPSVGIHFGRARGPFAEAGANGLAIFVCLVSAVMLSSRTRSPLIRNSARLIAAFCVLGLMFTLTRQIWVAALLAGSVSMIAIRSLRRYLVPATIVSVIGIWGAFALVPGLYERATSRGEANSPVWDRLNSNRAALAMIEARPLLGFGWYRFPEASPPYYQQSTRYPLTYVSAVHNVFLGFAVDLGLIGGFAWVVALLAAIGVPLSRRRGPPEGEMWRAGLLAVGLNWIVVANFTPLAYAFPNHMIWLWAGVAWAALVHRREIPLPEGREIVVTRAGTAPMVAASR